MVYITSTSTKKMKEGETKKKRKENFVEHTRGFAYAVVSLMHFVYTLCTTECTQCTQYTVILSHSVHVGWRAVYCVETHFNAQSKIF